MGSSGGTIDASGSNNANALGFTGTGAMGFNSQTGTRTLTLTGTNTANNTLAAVIGDNTGATSVTKTAAGTWVLSGANTYTGATTLTLGTLSVATDSVGAYNLGGTTGNNGITFDGGTLQVTGTAMTSFGSHTPIFNATKTVGLDINNASNTFTVSQALNQTSGGLTKSGAGTLTLTNAANNYTGATTVSAGTLNLTGSLTGATAIAVNGGTFSESSTGVIGSAAATLTVGGGIATLAGANTYTGTTALNSGTLNVNSVGALGTGAFTISGGTIDNTSTAAIASQTNNPAITLGGNFAFSTAGGTANNNLNLGTGAVTVTGSRIITLNPTTASTLTFGGTATNNTNAAVTTTVNGATDTVSFGAFVLNSGAATVTDVFNGSGKIIVAGAVTNGGAGTNALTYSGTGTMTLNGNNTYTGLTTMNNASGTLTLAGSNTTASGGVTLTAGTLNINNANALGAVGGTFTITAGTIDNTNGGLITNAVANPITDNGDFTFGGSNDLHLGTGAATLNIGSNGTRTITLNGSSKTLTLGGAVTASSATNNQTLTVNGAGNTLAMASLAINSTTSGHTLTINGSGNVSVAGAVTGGLSTANALSVSGTGKVTFAAGYSYTNATTIASGATLQLGNGATAVTMGGGAVTNSGTLIYDPNAAFTSTAVTGIGAVTIIGGQTVKEVGLSTGLLTLGDSSTTGTLDLNGTAQTVGGLTNGSFTPASNSIVNTGVAAALTIDTTNGSQSFGGVISPATANLISLVKTGSNTQTFNGATASTFTGGITVNAGTLALNEANVAGTNNLVSSSNALTMGGGTLSVSGGTQTLASLATTANTTSFLTLGASSTLTITSGTQSFGNSSLLTLNTSAGGANGATVGNAIMVWNTGTAGLIINNTFLVTDTGGTGFATKNGSNQIIRLNTTLLPASGAVSATNYFIDNNTGGTAAAGSNTLTLSASEAANSISVDTTTRSGTLDLGSGSFTLNNNNWSFAGANTYTINPGTGGNLKTVATGNAFIFDNVASGLVTINAPILAFGSNALTFNGTGTTVLAGANTYTGGTTINAGTVKAGVNQSGTTSGALGAGTGALTLNNASILDLNGFNVGVGALTGNSGTTITNNGGSAATLTAGNSNGGVTFTGSVSAGSGGLSITKAGTGGLTFGSTTALGSNINITFTGNTGFGESNIGGTIGNSTNTFIVANGVIISNFTTSGNSGWTLGANVSLGVGSIYTNNSDQTVSHSGNFTSTDSTAVINLTYGFHSNNQNISGDNSGFLGTVNIGDNGQGGRDALRLNSLTAGSASAIWHFNGNGAWAGNGVRLNGGAGTYSMGEITSTGGAGQIFANTAGSILQLGDNTANVASYSGTIVNSGLGITKVGTNTQILTGTNTYTGATTVNAGTLQVGVAGTGSTATGSAVSVNGASAVLAGTGTLNGATTVTSGTIKPGDTAGASVGTLNFNSLSYAGGATEIQISGGLDNATNRDHINVAGLLTLSNNSNINVSFNGFTPLTGTGYTWDILDWGSLTQGGFSIGTDGGTGGTNGNFVLPDISGIAGSTWTTSNFLINGQIAIVTTAPEPSRVLLLLAGMSLALSGRRRRR